MSFFDDIGKGVSSFATTVQSDATAFVAGAQTNVAQLLGSGVNSQGRITGPLAEHFGSDPVEFCLNATKHFATFFRGTVNRVAERSNHSDYSAPAPGGRGGHVQVKSRVSSRDSNAHVALVTALAATEHPAVLLEEAGRQQQGLPVKRGLDGGPGGYVWFPPMQSTARGFFGIDEAAAGAAALAIIVAIAPALITALVAIVGAIAPQVAQGVQDIFGGGKKEAPPPPTGLFGIDGLDPVMALVIAGAVVTGAWLLLRGRGAAA